MRRLERGKAVFDRSAFGRQSVISNDERTDMADKTARDIMTSNVDWIESQSTVLDAARKLAQEGVGALPICDNAKLKGMITDRDIVVKVLAEGKDPGTTKVIDLIQGEAVTIGADDSVEEALRTMSKYQV